MAVGVTAIGRTARSGVPTAISKRVLRAIAILDTPIDEIELARKRFNLSAIHQEA